MNGKNGALRRYTLPKGAQKAPLCMISMLRVDWITPVWYIV